MFALFIPIFAAAATAAAAATTTAVAAITAIAAYAAASGIHAVERRLRHGHTQNGTPEEAQQQTKLEEEQARLKVAEEQREREETKRKIEEEEKKWQEAIEEVKKEVMKWVINEIFDEIKAKKGREDEPSNFHKPSNFNFAIVGSPGSGKSSLINAFINLESPKPGVAPTDTNKTTLEITRYTDPGTKAPQNKIVWYKVPVRGTKDSIIRPELYVFDLIVLVIGDSFTQIDAGIVKDCERFKVPLFIVRPQADEHICKMMGRDVDDNYGHISDNPELYKECRDRFLEQTKQSVSEELRKEELQDQKVYIVSENMLKRTYNSASQIESQELKDDPAMIHEMDLVTDLLDLVRRCDMKQKAVEDGIGRSTS